MRRKEAWSPTKFVMSGRKLQGDQTGRHVSVGSRILTDLVAQYYQEALRKYARGSLLDLGCGNAPLFGLYRSLVDSIICVDWPDSTHQQNHVDVFADLTKHLPFSSSQFDTILLSDVLEHIPNPENLLSEISRILRPSGCVIIGVPFLYWLHEVPHDYNRYTRYQLERLCQTASLNILELNEIGGSPEVLADIISKMLATRPLVAKAFVIFARYLLKRRRIRRMSERTRQLFPIEYVLVGQRLPHTDETT